MRCVIALSSPGQVTRLRSFAIIFRNARVLVADPVPMPICASDVAFDPDAWGQGYATEAARAALAEGFTTLGFAEICSLPQVENVASVRVAERLGMRNEGIATIAANERFGEKDAVLFWMTAEEWRSG